MKPPVHVICLTYNHEKYIVEALESFVRQKTNFEFKVYVGDDCSTDSTKEKILDYYKKYPDIIVPVLREKNLGPTNNLADLCTTYPAKYIAFCEGDDYWVDEYKLQKQYDYMEANTDIDFCFTKTKIIYPENWGLLKWYKMVDGQILYPDSIPGFQPKDKYRAPEIIKTNIAHTSSYFFRWKCDIKFPDWYYNSVLGDISLLLLQLGKGYAGYIPEITSVYRRNDTGVFMTYDETEFFKKTRKEYIRYLEGLIRYFTDYHDGFAVKELENRLVTEYLNLLKACRESKDYSQISEIIKLHPSSTEICLKELEKRNVEFSKVINILGKQRLLCLQNNKYLRSCFKHIIDTLDTTKLKKYFRRRIYVILRKIFFDEDFYVKTYPNILNTHLTPYEHYKKIGKSKGYKAYNINIKYSDVVISWLSYWCYSIIPKNKRLWVFSSFYKKGFVDNTKYLFEYISKNHKDITCVWLTLDNATFVKLKDKGLNVQLMNSFKGRYILSRAKVAVTDHFVRSDYSSKYGLNARTKVVQLWHGVGLKNMKPNKDFIPNTKVPGVRLSSDILISDDDSFIIKIKKAIKYLFYAPFRELPEKYFGFLCPGQEHIDMLAKPWHIDTSALIYSGHPRNELMYRAKKKNSILYAPTYRWDALEEQRLIDDLVNALPSISKCITHLNLSFTIRLHPHTWRNYSKLLGDELKKYTNIFYDDNKDVYTNIGEHSILITDYSSIAYDFLLLDRPIIFLHDFKKEEDEQYNYPYKEYSPGSQVSNWSDALVALEKYTNDPELDAEWRKRIFNEFFFKSSNDEFNSERIYKFIKNKLSIN